MGRVTAAAAALMCFVGTATAEPPAGWTQVLDGYRQLLRQAGIAGSSLMIVRDGAIVARDAEGFQDLSRKTATTDATIYHWASITKTFTGIAIMQLRDRGLLSLDDPVVKYVPELRAGAQSRSATSRRSRSVI